MNAQQLIKGLQESFAGMRESEVSNLSPGSIIQIIMMQEQAQLLHAIFQQNAMLLKTMMQPTGEVPKEVMEQIKPTEQAPP